MHNLPDKNDRTVDNLRSLQHMKKNSVKNCFSVFLGKLCKILTLEERIIVLKELDSGKSCRQVAIELRVGKPRLNLLN